MLSCLVTTQWLVISLALQQDSSYQTSDKSLQKIWLVKRFAKITNQTSWSYKWSCSGRRSMPINYILRLSDSTAPLVHHGLPSTCSSLHHHCLIEKQILMSWKMSPLKNCFVELNVGIICQSTISFHSQLHQSCCLKIKSILT